MEKKRISDERLAELIRAAALRREVPVGLETRVMAQVILRDRRRRERRRSRQWLATARLPSRR